MSVIGIEIEPVQLVLTRGRDFKWSFQNLDENNEPEDFSAGELYFELATGGQHNARQNLKMTGAAGRKYQVQHWMGVYTVYREESLPTLTGAIRLAERWVT